MAEFIIDSGKMHKLVVSRKPTASPPSPAKVATPEKKTKPRPDEPLNENDILISCQIDINDNLEEQTGTIILTHKSGGSVIKEYTFPLADAYNSSKASGWVEVIAKDVTEGGEFDMTIEYQADSENGNEKEVLTIFTDIPYESLETESE